MLRMNLKAQSTREVILTLHGKLAGAAVQLLEQEGENHLRATPRLLLDLDGVPFIDEAGLVLLQQWVGEKVRLRGGSPFLRALLAAEGLVSK